MRKFWVIGWKSSLPPIPRRRESETNWFSGFFLTANQCRQMFLPPMTASADTTTPTPTRIKITDPAAWLVRVERRMAAAEKDYDFQMFKAILVFPVQ
jgi:hypothetical protein